MFVMLAFEIVGALGLVGPFYLWILFFETLVFLEKVVLWWSTSNEGNFSGNFSPLI